MLAAQAPDKIAAGDPVTIKVYVYYGGCIGWGGFAVETRNDTIFVVPRGRVWAPSDALQPAQSCPATSYLVEQCCVVPPPALGDWIVAVVGWEFGPALRQIILPVHVGTTPAPIRRYAWRFEHTTSHVPIVGARVTVLEPSSRWEPNWDDTLAVLTTDAVGCVTYTSPCISDTAGYQVRIDAPGYERMQYYWSAPRCGAAERGTYWVWPSSASSQTPASAIGGSGPTPGS
jgi:hypothetical protein